MKKVLIAPILVLASVSLAAPAMADPVFKADDIVEFFSEDNLGATRSLGGTRSLCEGTQDECDGKEVRRFDLEITFDLNSDSLTPEARQNLDEFVKALNNERLANASFSVDGHTDATGSDEYNLDLSQRRANSVVGYLSSKGIDSSRLIAKGHGESDPKGDNPFAAENRRVETQIISRQ